LTRPASSTDKAVVSSLERIIDALRRRLNFDLRKQSANSCCDQPIAVRELRMLNNTKVLQHLAVPPDNQVEALKGDRAGQHSIRINRQWRISFVWTTGSPDRVEIVDYTRQIPNPTPGDVLLLEFIEPMGLTQNGLARAIGVPPRRVLGKRSITPDTHLRLARYFGVSEGFWLGLQADHDLLQRRREIVSATHLPPRAARSGSRTRTSRPSTRRETDPRQIR
jgi:antitoxin HigA-1